MLYKAVHFAKPLKRQGFYTGYCYIKCRVVPARNLTKDVGSVTCEVCRHKLIKSGFLLRGQRDGLGRFVTRALRP